MTDDTKMTASEHKIMDRLRQFLCNEKIEDIYQHRSNELVIKLQNGITLFIDSGSELEFSITE